MSTRRVFLPAAAGAALLVLAGALEGTDFIRGDANNDGRVTISDTHFTLNFLFRWTLAASVPTCLQALEVNLDGRVDISDPIHTLGAIFLGGPAISAPFPDPGPAPDPEGIGCEEYGGGTPIEDPAAKIQLLDLVAAGGDDASGLLTLAVSSSAPTAGLSVRIIDADGVIASTRGPIELSHPEAFSGFRTAQLHEGAIQVGYLTEFTQALSVPAGQDVEVLAIPVCLRVGVDAGDYPLRLESGELADFESGRAVIPALAGGTLTVNARVNATACTDPTVPPPVNVRFALGETESNPGGAAVVPFSVRATVESQGFAFSVDFDEGVLQAESVEKLWQRGGGTPYEFEKFEWSNADAATGSAGLDEGFVVGAAIFSLADTALVIPPRVTAEVLNLHFRVNPAAPAGETALRFIDGGQVTGGPVENKLISRGSVVTPALADAFILINGRVNIVPDVTTFIRGDSNGDLLLDVSDPVAALSYLYQGGDPPRCFDAADANDDGLLDIADPVMCLGSLYLGTGPLPPPSGSPGTDPTPDAMSCLWRS